MKQVEKAQDKTESKTDNKCWRLTGVFCHTEYNTLNTSIQGYI